MIEGEKKTLDGYISAYAFAATCWAVIGTIVILAGMTATGIMIYFLYSFGLCCYTAYAVFIIALTLYITAIILLFIYKSNLNLADYYRKEVIVLQNIGKALDICTLIDDNDIVEITVADAANEKTKKRRTEKTRMQEQIIEALLSRCI